MRTHHFKELKEYSGKGFASLIDSTVVPNDHILLISIIPRRRNLVKLAKMYIAGIAFHEWMQRQHAAVTMNIEQDLLKRSIL